MASLQKKGDAWYCQFVFARKRHTLTIGEVTQSEAERWKAKAEDLLMRLKQRYLEVPPGVSIVDFILFDGKPPVDPEFKERKDVTFGELKAAYITTFSNGAIESNTLATAKIHLAHLEATLGKKFLLSGLTLGRLQQHITRRQTSVGPVTIKKEIATFRAAWNWAARGKLVRGVFPSAGLVYAKVDEKLPFMNWAEIERRIAAGADPVELWEALYLEVTQVAALLGDIKLIQAPDWLYPMVVTAAHSGMRRSELIRVRREDIDLKARIITVREKKRAIGSRTTRRVPVSKLLSTTLKPLLSNDRHGAFLFGDGVEPVPVQTVHKALVRVLAGTKWSVVRGWHVFRHSFISACASKGVDQRFLDAWVGHQTEEQRSRYRHLYPSVQDAALQSVFG